MHINNWSELHVLVTRPEHQASELMHALEKKGARAKLFPTFKIVALADQPILKNTCETLSHYDIALFNSANAATIATQYWPHGTNIEVIAIGKGTQSACENVGIPVDHIPNTYNSEGMLALPTLSSVNQKKVVIFCGKNPRPLLTEELRERGAEVTLVECYERIIPSYNMDAELAAFKQTQINLIISTSCESLQNLYYLCQSDPEWLFSTTIVVISKRMQQTHDTLGFKQPCILAKNATTLEIIQALQKKFMLK